MPRESKVKKSERAAAIFDRLAAEYPEAHCALHFEDAYQLGVATILSAQCTDERVNMVTPVLFERFSSPQELAGAKTEEVEDIIRSTGFFRNKTKSIIGFAQGVVDVHSGAVPRSMEALRKLPGVGRKTANVILGNAFGIDEGVVVDTHVKRLSTLMGLTKQTTPEKIEVDLMGLIPQERWTLLAHLLIWHGRAKCVARRPRCGECVVAGLCPSSQV